MSSLAGSLPNTRTGYIENERHAVITSFPAKTDAKVSVVIPTLNEAENLPFVLPRIPAWVDEVLLVDGRSTDNTVEVAKKLRHDIRIVYEGTRGKGAALRRGFAEATGDIIVMLDADGSTDPAEIPYFVGALLSGADYAKGTRFVQGGGTADMPLYRKMGNWSFVLLVRMLYGGRYSDLCYGYNAFWKRAVLQLNLDGNGFEIETMMNIRALQAKLKIAEVPSFEAKRIYGSSNLKTIPDGWRVVKTIGKEWLRPTIQSGRQAVAQTTNPPVSIHEPAIMLNGNHHLMLEAVPVMAASNGQHQQPQSNTE